MVTLTYHRVHSIPDVYNEGDVDANSFAWQMQILSRYFNVIRLDEAVKRICEGQDLPSRSIAVTFDDGYLDNATVALPIMLKYSIPATFFIATATIDGGIMWNDCIIEAIRRTKCSSLDLRSIGLGVIPVNDIGERISAVRNVIGKLKYEESKKRSTAAQLVVEAAGVTLPDNLMMSSHDVARLAQLGMEIGSHTHNHPILRNLSEDEIRAEIAHNREILEGITQIPVVGFAYPNGRAGVDYAERERNLVADSGLQYAMTTNWGHISNRCDRFALPRIAPWDRRRVQWSARIALAFFQ